MNDLKRKPIISITKCQQQILSGEHLVRLVFINTVNWNIKSLQQTVFTEDGVLDIWSSIREFCRDCGESDEWIYYAKAINEIDIEIIWQCCLNGFQTIGMSMSSEYRPYLEVLCSLPWYKWQDINEKTKTTKNLRSLYRLHYVNELTKNKQR